MSISRKAALKRLQGLSLVVEEHLRKIADNPGIEFRAHWIAEINCCWLDRMTTMLAFVGQKTAQAWVARIEDYARQIEEETYESDA